MARKRTFVTGMIIGSLVGATAALLMAPKSGKELRKDLQKWYTEMEKDVNTNLAQMKKVSKQSYNQVVDKVAETYKKLQKLDTKDLDQIKKVLLKKWDKVQSELEGSTEKAAKVVKKKVTTAKKRIVRKK